MQAALTPVAVATAAVLVMLVPARIRARREESGLQLEAQDMALTCVSAAMATFVFSLLTLGVPEGAWKVGGTMAALIGVGLVLGSLITLLGRLDRDR